MLFGLAWRLSELSRRLTDESSLIVRLPDPLWKAENLLWFSLFGTGLSLSHDSSL
jgi:hypothetical protein